MYAVRNICIRTSIEKYFHENGKLMEVLICTITIYKRLKTGKKAILVIVALDDSESASA